MTTFSLTLERLPFMDRPRPPRPALDAVQTPRSDAESTLTLLARARGGDAAALDDLCARYLPRLQRWAHGRLPSWARGALDTHDLVQDTLTQVFQRVGSLEPRHAGAFQGYLHQALRNRVLDEIRRARRRGSVEELDPAQSAHEASPLEHAIGQEALERYKAALQRLRPEDREAIIARIELDLPYAEVVELLGKPSVAAAHMAVSRALVRLAEEMARG